MNTPQGFRGDPRDGSRLPEEEAYWANLQRTVVEQGREVLGAYGDLDRGRGETGTEPHPWTAPAWAVSALAVTAAAAVLLILALPSGTGGASGQSEALDGATGTEAVWSRSVAPGDPLGDRLVGPEPPSLLDLAFSSPVEARR